MKCKECYQVVDDTLVAKLKEYKVPFVCKTCGMLKFPYQALKGIVFVWPKPIPEKQGSIYIPDVVRSAFKMSAGMVMSTGKGCVDKKTDRFVPAGVAPGDVISYDKAIPWQVEVPDSEENKHTVDMMSVLDILATGEEDDDEREDSKRDKGKA